MVKESKLGATPDLAYLKSGLADLYMEMGKMDQVEKLLKQAYDINKRKLGEDQRSLLKEGANALVLTRTLSPMVNSAASASSSTT